MNEIKSKKRAHLQLNLMLLITVIPIAAAYIAYFTGWGVPAGTVNNGALLTPAKNVQDWFESASGELPDYQSNKQWHLFVPVKDCDEQCDALLYLTRQVHIRLAQKSDRIERYMVNLNGLEGERLYERLKPSHPKMKLITLDYAQWKTWLSETNAPDIEQQAFYLLVDQVGFAMMHYTEEQDGNALLKDIKRVLKYSPD